MSKLEAYIEAERRGILPPDKAGILQEARRRGLVPATEHQEKEGLARTLFDQGMQGLTFGLADEVSDRLGAGIASLATGENYGDMLKQARQLTSESQKRQWEQRPGASIAANIAGGLLTGGAGATTKAGAAAGNFLRSGNLAARAGKGAATGAASAGLYSIGTGEDGERTANLGRDMLLGATIAGAIPVAGAGLNRLNTRTIIPNADSIRARAGEMYQAAERAGGVLNSNFTNKFVDAVERLKPQTDIGRIIGGDDAFSKVVDRLGQIRDRPMSLGAAQELDELLGDAIDGFTEMGRVTKQGKKLLDVQTTLREMIENAGNDMVMGGRTGFDALKEARNLWSTSHRMNDIERIIQRADQYDQPATAIKTGFRTLLNNPRKMRGYSDAERAAIKRAAESGVVTDLLRTAGSRLFPLLTGASGGGIGATAAAQAGSMASRGMATRFQVGRANKAAQEIAKRSGMISKEKRIQVPDNWREVLRLKPRDAQKIIDEIRLLPAPEREFAVDMRGTISQMSPEDAVGAQIARQRATEIGLTPDVRRTIEQRRIQIDQMMKSADWDKIDAARKALIVDQIEQAWRQNMQSLPDMISQARGRVSELASEIGDEIPETLLGNKLIEAADKAGQRQGIDDIRDIRLEEIMKMKPSEAKKYLTRRK